MQDEFVDVSQFTPNWNPRSTGTKKEGNRKDLEANDSSWIVGWYLGKREVTIDNKVYTVHKILANRVGNQDHLGEPLIDGESKMYEFFGTNVLDSQLAEHVQPGQYVQIAWLGMTQPKKAGGANYHNWKVGVSQKTEPIAVQNGTPVSGGMIDSTADIASGNMNAGDEEAPAQEIQPAAEAGGPVSGGDDLPF